MKKIYLLLIVLPAFFVARSQSVYSDNTWKATSTLFSGWELPSFNDAAWGSSTAPNPGTGTMTCKDQGIFNPNVLPMWNVPEMQYTYLRKTFTIADINDICSDNLTAAADDDIDVYVNGTLVIQDATKAPGPTFSVSVYPYLVTGTNVIAVRGNNLGGFCRVCLVFTPGLTFTPDAGPDLELCKGDSVQLNLSGTPPGSTYSWSPAAGLSCTNCQNPVAKPSVTTAYKVMVNKSTCSGQDSVTITVTPSLVAYVAPVDTTICSGNPFQLKASTGGSAYQWSPSTGLSDSTVADPVLTPSVTTVYTVAVSDGICPVSYASSTIHVLFSPPFPSITQTYNTLTCSYDSSYKAYQWYFGTNLLSGATSPVLVIGQEGNYNVQVTGSSGCSVASGINVKLDTLTGIADLKFSSAGDDVTVSPNPVTDKLVITSHLPHQKDMTLEIYNALGERVCISKLPPQHGVNKTFMDVSYLAPGIYFLKVTGSGSDNNIKFVKAEKIN